MQAPVPLRYRPIIPRKMLNLSGKKFRKNITKGRSPPVTRWCSPQRRNPGRQERNPIRGPRFSRKETTAKRATREEEVMPARTEDKFRSFRSAALAGAMDSAKDEERGGRGCRRLRGRADSLELGIPRW